MPNKKPKWIFFTDKATKKSVMLYVVKETSAYVWGILCDDSTEKVIKISRKRITCTLEEV